MRIESQKEYSEWCAEVADWPDDRNPDKKFIDDLRTVCEKHGVELKTPWENGDRYYFMSKAGRFSVPLDDQFNREVLGRNGVAG